MKELESLGLTRREIDVYLALLGLGSSSVGEIVKRSKVPSSKIYEVLNKLVDRGLVSFIIKGKTKYFQASEPETFLEIVEEKKVSIEKIIPDLKSRQNKSKEEGAVLFSGIDGMKTALRRVLKTLRENEDYFAYIPPSENLGKEVSKIFFNNFNIKIRTAKIKIKLLIHESHRETIKKDYSTLDMRQVKFTDFSFPSRLGIFRGHVLIINSGQKNISSILIKSEEAPKFYSQFFLELWRKGKK